MRTALFHLFQCIFAVGIFFAAFFLIRFTTPAHAAEKIKLIFSVDQGVSNGLIINADQNNSQYVQTVNRVFSTLQKFSPKYDVYILVNPMVRDKQKLFFVLDAAKQHNLKFVFDVYSSDTWGIGSRTAVPNPTLGGSSINLVKNIPSGIAMGVDELSPIKQKYGSYFAGLRFHELVGADYIELLCFREHLSTCDIRLVADNPETQRFYNKAFAEEFIQFAYQNQMFVDWSDPDFFDPWCRSCDRPGLYRGPQILSDMNELAAKYPDTIYGNYANNEGTGPTHRLATWQTKFSGKPYFAGFGLSNQSWLCYGTQYTDENCPVSYMSQWTKDAVSKGANNIQFEPFWYFFSWPRMDIGPNPVIYSNNSTSINWSTAGQPTGNLSRTAQDLGIDLNASCMGDVNGDQVVNLADYSLLMQNFSKSSNFLPESDMNKDGVVDIRDISLLLGNFLKPCP